MKFFRSGRFGFFEVELEVGCAEFFQGLLKKGDALLVVGEVAFVKGIVAGEAGLEVALGGEVAFEAGDEVFKAWEFRREV